MSIKVSQKRKKKLSLTNEVQFSVTKSLAKPRFRLLPNINRGQLVSSRTVMVEGRNRIWATAALTGNKLRTCDHGETSTGVEGRVCSARNRRRGKRE